MKLSRALKEKNRIVGRINERKSRIAADNSKEVRAKRSCDVLAEWAAMVDDIEELVRVKAAIQRANADLAFMLCSMQELRSMAAWLGNINTKEGEVEQVAHFSGSVTKSAYEVVIPQRLLNDLKDRITKALERIQDDVDEFNASHSLEEIDCRTGLLGATLSVPPKAS